MGNPYRSELALLEKTYSWCLKQNIEGLSKAVASASNLPLVTIGSGGSFSAAEFMAGCHRAIFKQLAVATTPLEARASFSGTVGAGVWLFSAGGRNIDARRCFKHFALLEPRQLGVVVGRKNSPLKEMASGHQYIDFFEHELPSKKDGFLATNSLVAFCTLLVRAYYEVVGKSDQMPASLDALMSESIGNLDKLEKTLAPIWKKQTIQLLYSNALKSGALDVESKFTEAGLRSILLADLRNFAHGRHHWFAKRGSESGLIAFSTKSDASLAHKTLALLPKDIPQTHIQFKSDDLLAQLAAVIMSIKLTGWAGASLEIDPGNPGVPPFGRKIYQLKESSGFTSKISEDSAALSRKMGCELERVAPATLKAWEMALSNFQKKLKKEKFGAIVLDYDGTLVDTRHRFDLPTKEVVDALHRLLKSGILIGIATGRGQSVRKDLKKVIHKKYWKQIIIGYYNGSDIAYLDNDHAPDGAVGAEGRLAEVMKILDGQKSYYEITQIDARKRQITVNIKKGLPEYRLWDIAQNLLGADLKSATHIWRSSHSIDIVDCHVTKTDVIKRLQELIGSNVPVLAIGDRGKWPGNDYTMLSNELSLSVDEVSPVPETCWNLAPAGVKGVQATLFYFKNLKCISGKAPFIQYRN